MVQIDEESKFENKDLTKDEIITAYHYSLKACYEEMKITDEKVEQLQAERDTLMRDLKSCHESKAKFGNKIIELQAERDNYKNVLIGMEFENIEQLGQEKRDTTVIGKEAQKRISEIISERDRLQEENERLRELIEYEKQSNANNVSLYEMRCKELESVVNLVNPLINASEEICDLMNDVRNGDYTPDSFTNQPVKEAIYYIKAALQEVDGGKD